MSMIPTVVGLGGTSNDPAPPEGAAGGDLAGTYPNPTVAQVAGVVAATVAGQRTAHELAFTHANLPTTNEKAALAGTGTPSASDKYVSNSDARNTNSRAPNGSATGDLSGSYPNPSVATVGGATAAAIAAQLPTANEKAALAGTGTPSGSDKYVSNSDARNTNSRAPNGSAGGDLSGTYPSPSVATMGGIAAAVLAANLPATGEKAALAGTSGTPGSGNKYVTDADGRLVGPWVAIDLSTGTVLITAPSVGGAWEIILYVASSEATTASTASTFLNGETTLTNYWTQQQTGSNAASAPNESNSPNLVQYTGSTAPTGAKAFNRIILPDFRGSGQKIAVLDTAFSRAAGDAVVGKRVMYRTGASVGAVNDAITSFGYTLPSAGTHAAGSYGFHRWVSA